MKGFWLLMIPSILKQRSQGLLLSHLQACSLKEADCDVISSLFLSCSFHFPSVVYFSVESF